MAFSLDPGYICADGPNNEIGWACMTHLCHIGHWCGGGIALLNDELANYSNVWIDRKSYTIFFNTPSLLGWTKGLTLDVG
jgi:hypothetical protein